MTLMNAWRWIRYPRIAWNGRIQHRPCKGCGMRCVAYYRHEGRFVCINCWQVAGRDLQVWKLALLAVGALVAALAIWWPTDLSDVRPALERPAVIPTERVLPLERPSRPPHPIEIYRPPGRN